MTFAEAAKQSEGYGNGFYIKEYIESYIAQNCQSDYEFLTEFNTADLIYSIGGIVTNSGLSNDININELLEVGNYESYFKKKYGIDNCDKNTLFATDKFITFLDGLTKGVKNKQAFIWAMNEYLTNEDKAAVHTILHR